MKELLKYVAQQLVDEPEEVEVRQVQGERSMILELRVAPKDMGKVIGKQGKNIDPAQALDHVWGYTIVNDVTARDIQMRHKQWDMGKSFDTFCPMGPCLVTADALPLGKTTVFTNWRGYCIDAVGATVGGFVFMFTV